MIRDRLNRPFRIRQQIESRLGGQSTAINETRFKFNYTFDSALAIQRQQQWRVLDMRARSLPGGGTLLKEIQNDFSQLSDVVKHKLKIF